MPASIDDTPDSLMERYSTVLTELSERPYDRSLHELHLSLASELGDDQAKEEAREMLATYFPLSQDEWTSWIEDRQVNLKLKPDAMEQQVGVLDLYSRATRELIYMPLLVSYSQHVISSYYASQGFSLPAVNPEEDDDDDLEDAKMTDLGSRRVGEPDPLLGAVFALDNVREVREEVLNAGGRHLSEGQSLWLLWRSFEFDLLTLATTPEEKTQQLAEIDRLYLARLAVPHLQIDETFAAYSSFITRYDNDHYGEKLPAANKVFSAAKKAVEERDEEERKLTRADCTEQAYLAYLNWELEVKRPDYVQVRALFERALSHHPSSLEICSLYLDSFAKAPKALANIVQIAERAVRAMPQEAKLWTTYFRIAEKHSIEVDALFERAMSSGLLEDNVDGLVALYEGRAGFHRRQVDQIIPPGEERENMDMIDLVVGILQEGITRVREASKRGDPQLRLEKYLLRQLERFGRIEEATEVWESITSAMPSSYSVWYGRADFLTRHNDLATAHAVYVEGCSDRSLDYPEYLLDAWQAFEIQNGNLADLEFSLAKIARQRKGLERKREREMRQYQEAQAAQAAQQQQANHFISETVAESGKKRERSPVPTTAAAAVASIDESPAPKKARTDEATQVAPAAGPSSAPAHDSDAPTRDRENSTVFVTAPVSINMTESDLVTLFRDCGAFRECKLKTLGGSIVAMIEFMSADDVLAARTKDKKRIREEEVQVEVAWQSCLYVTNFPEEWDKDKVEEVFGEFGTIFDTRWPSKRFKSTRRFCYVQFTNAEAASSATSALHNRQLDPTHRLQALISDPNRKKGRTDLGANNRELYIAGLSKFTKELDLRRLFEPHGTIKGIRLGEDEKGDCRGFAFVEYEEEASAQAALALNNTELKKRHISVTIAQPRARGTQSAIDSTSKREPRTAIHERSARVSGIEPGTEEAIVQQAFEKIAKVKLVSMDVGATQAVVEFENAAEAGKVLLAAASEEGIIVEGKKVDVVADGPQLRGAAATSVGAHSRPKTDAPLLPRQAGRGRGRVGLGMRGRGSGRGGLGSRSSAAGPTPAAAGSSASTSGGGTTAAAAGAKSQDDFRALLNKK